MSNGEQTKRVIIAERKGISDQIAKQNHSRVIKPIKEDQEINSKQDQNLRGTVIIVENQDTNKLNVEQGSRHWSFIKSLKQIVRTRKRKSSGNMNLLKTP